MSQPEGGKSVLLAGATGLVGGECLDLLLADPSTAHITAIARRSITGRAIPERLSVERIDFDHLDERPSLFAVDMIFCALGTTIRQAGTQKAFRRVDFEYPLQIARLGYPSLTIVRPSLLLGNRQVRRFGEGMGKFFAFLTPSRMWPCSGPAARRGTCGSRTRRYTGAQGDREPGTTA